MIKDQSFVYLNYFLHRDLLGYIIESKLALTDVGLVGMNIMRLHLCTFVLLLAAAMSAIAQDTIATNSPEGREIIAAAKYAVGDCLAGPKGAIVPNAKAAVVACDSEDANWLVKEVVINAFDCPKGSAKLMQIGPDNATFCLTLIEH